MNSGTIMHTTIRTVFVDFELFWSIHYNLTLECQLGTKGYVGAQLLPQKS
jgi:hypothetical protein